MSSSLGRIEAFVSESPRLRCTHDDVTNLDVSVKEAERWLAPNLVYDPELVEE